MEPTNLTAVVGEAVAGQAAKFRDEINDLIAGINTSEFDLAERLYEVKSQVQQELLPCTHCQEHDGGGIDERAVRTAGHCEVARHFEVGFG
jgi:hypothetical protein